MTSWQNDEVAAFLQQFAKKNEKKKSLKKWQKSFDKRFSHTLSNVRLHTPWSKPQKTHCKKVFKQVVIKGLCVSFAIKMLQIMQSWS
jgi:hypothetical protein